MQGCWGVQRDVILVNVVFITWYMKAIDVVTMITVFEEPFAQLRAAKCFACFCHKFLFLS